MEKWIQRLMESAFEKVDKNSIETTVNGKSRYLSQKMEENFGFLLSDRNITRYYRGYVSREEKRIRPNKATLNALAEYLGYNGFKDFVQKNQTDEDTVRRFSGKIRELNRNMRFSLITNIILIGGLLFFISKYYKKNCMIWIDDHYERIRCSDLELETGLNEDVLEKFKKNTVN